MKLVDLYPDNFNSTPTIQKTSTSGVSILKITNLNNFPIRMYGMSYMLLLHLQKIVKNIIYISKYLCSYLHNGNTRTEKKQNKHIRAFSQFNQKQ